MPTEPNLSAIPESPSRTQPQPQTNSRPEPNSDPKVGAEASVVLAERLSYYLISVSTCVLSRGVPSYQIDSFRDHASLLIYDHITFNAHNPGVLKAYRSLENFLKTRFPKHPDGVNWKQVVLAAISNASNGVPMSGNGPGLANAPFVVPTSVPASAPPLTSASALAPASADSSAPPIPRLPTIGWVRALYSFESADKSDLEFEKGDIIRVTDCNHEGWWEGQLKGRTGLFPVPYVELLPELTAADIAREADAEAEAAVFAKAENIDKLLDSLRDLDNSKQNLVGKYDIQGLYWETMPMQPEIMRLIGRYSQTSAELSMMNENLTAAKVLFDRMMEQSSAKYNPGGYEYAQLRPYQPNEGHQWPGASQGYDSQKPYPEVARAGYSSTDLATSNPSSGDNIPNSSRIALNSSFDPTHKPGVLKTL